jgi:predicted membrane channel-forming protein YqfA (hemolysin III family)
METGVLATPTARKVATVVYYIGMATVVLPLLSLLIVAIAVATVSIAKADTLTYSKGAIEIEIKKGAFRQSDRKVEQMLIVTNNSRVMVKTIFVECGFFHDDLLIGRDSEYVGNLQPGQSAYAKMDAYILNVNKSDCRIESASQ